MKIRLGEEFQSNAGFEEIIGHGVMLNHVLPLIKMVCAAIRRFCCPTKPSKQAF
jgi:hypothetical protein